MSLKNILVHIDDSESRAVRLEVAINLALSHQAHLSGVYTAPQMYIPPYLAAEVGPEIYDVQKKAVAESSAKAEAVFLEATKHAGLAAEWRSGEGDPADIISMHARHADLVVLGQTNPEGEGVPDLPEQVVLEAGRPILVVPYVGKYPHVGERVLVAWNASREAARAVNDALPLLERAKHVTVLAINPHGGNDGHGEVPGADISLHLARHGVKAEAAHVFADDVDVGNMLLSRAADASADLIVMGAYGRSRLRELVMGGASHTLLHHMTVPVLMSH